MTPSSRSRKPGSLLRRAAMFGAAFTMLAGAGQAMATYAVGDRVWNDVNNNGVFDANEVGVSGVSLGLYTDANADCVPDSTTAVRSGTTNASGAYLFTGVGNSRYIVQIQPANFTGTGVLVGYRSSTGSSSTTTGPYEPGLNESNNAADNNKDHGKTTTNTSGQTVIRACHIVIVGGTEPVGEGNQPPGIINPDTDPNTNNTIDLGVYKPTILGALGDRVWEDRDHDGVQDAGEPGVAGVTVKLLDVGGTTLIASQLTNSSGNYLFSNLAPGTYMIEVVPPAGAQLTLEDIGADQALDSDPNVGTFRTTEGVVTGGQTNTAIDAGIWYPLTLGNLVWRDNNNNGVVDAGEPGIGGVTVNLLNSTGGLVATTTTAATTGEYTFANLVAGDYKVQIPATNFAAGAPLAGLTTSTGGSTEPAPDPDNNVNNDDNGTANAGAVISLPGTLSSNTEPTNDGDGANGNLTVDFGFIPPQPGALGDRVWLDQNRNGVQDAGEPGIPGVTVQLRDATGATLLATQSTNASGNYLFSNLQPGTYVIDFVKPAGYEFTLEDIGADQALDSDPAVGTGRTSEGVVTAGQTNSQIDAGLYIPLNLGDLVWRDLDNDGRVDAGEPGIGQVAVELLNSAGTVVGSTTTNPSGLYLFSGLVPGDYSVRLPAANFAAGGPLAGLESSTGGGSEPAPDPDNDVNNDDNGSAAAGAIASAQITLASGTEPAGDGDGTSGNLTADFGLIARAAVGDRVWLDQNGNGIQDAGEPGVQGVTVTICNATTGAVVATTTTNANGEYLLAGLLPGAYNLGFTNLPAGAVLTPANQGANDATDSDAPSVAQCNIPVTLTSGQTTTTVDAGVYFPLTLGNLVWRDTNNDGLSAGEAGISGVTVQLLNSSGTVIATTSTNATGNYLFTGLAPGAYSVRIPSSNFTGPLSGLATSTGGGSEPAPDPDNDIDNDDNGTQVGANVDSGQITLASGTEPGNDGDGTSGNLTVDVGFIVPSTASIGDRVWLDRNGNGFQDAGEPGVEGVTVSLCNAAGTVIATTPTDANGNYLFSNLAAGSYQIGIGSLPSGFALTQPNQGANDTVDSDVATLGACTVPVTLAAGEAQRDIDAGVYATLNLGNLVWRDLNNSGVVDAGEPGVSGVTVELLNGAGTVVQTTSTNGTGNYSFSGLAPGDYRVRIPAANFAAGAPLAGTISSSGNGTEPAQDPDNDVDNDDNGTGPGNPVTSGLVTLASGTEPANDGDGGNGNLTVDFGFTPTPASVGDRVWHDQNGNGIQDAGEPGVTGVTVSLCTTAGTVIASMQTDANGVYSFTNVLPGNYLVGFTALPLGAVLTSVNQGANDATDSDAGATGVCTIPVTLAPGDSNTTVDAGLYFPLTLGNLVWRDANNNGVSEAGEPGLANVPVDLLDAAGTPVGTTFTNGIGQYAFTGLAPGTYSVRVPTTPTGLVSSTGNDPTPDPDNNVDNDDNGTGSPVASQPITLVSGGEPTNDGDGANGNLTVDFGFTPVASVGDRVWEDVNHNGIQDAGEPGVPGVTVSLCVGGTAALTTTTDASGNYQFANLAPGSYQVGITNLPAGTQLTLANQNGNDAADSDMTSIGPCNVALTLAPGENNTSVDAGIWYPLTLGNLVWRDTNNNGLVDAGEPGIQGVAVELLTPGGTSLGTRTTDAGGLYQFGDLAAGDYVVRLPAGNFTGAGQLVNFTSSTGNDPAPDPDNNVDGDDNGTTSAGTITSAPITLARGTEPADDGDGANGNQTLDFGVVPPPSVGDRVWEDVNHNGIQDAGEPGLAGVTVTLCDPQGNVLATRISDANGNYLFANLAPGSYQVGFTTLPAGGQLTLANQNGNDAADSDATAVATCNVPVTLAPGQVNNTVDAGVWFPLTVGNLVFRDLNNNGVADPAEPGIQGVVVQLVDAGGNVTSTTTGPTGTYSFSGLATGDYAVRISADNFAAGGPLDGLATSNGGASEPASDPDSNVDGDDNGTANGPIVETAPISLARGTEPSNDGDGANGNLTVDFGFYLPDLAAASIGDFVWLDQDHDGVQDPGEPGIAGVTVNLCVGGQVLATQITGPNGQYRFTGLAPGTYQVGVTSAAPGLLTTVANAGANDTADSDLASFGACAIPVTVVAGQTDNSIDIGLYSLVRLGNLVWIDRNNNGVVDAGEPGVPGVTMELLNDAGTVIATTSTNPSGNYLFDQLQPGRYAVQVSATDFAPGGALAGFVTSTGANGSPVGSTEPGPSPDNDTDNDDNGTVVVDPASGGNNGNNGNPGSGNNGIGIGVGGTPPGGGTAGRVGGPGSLVSSLVTVTSGGEPIGDGDDANGNLTVDFGVFQPATIGDFVWSDGNRNGVQDPGETGVAGVTVTLLSGGTPISVATTSVAGGYLFTNVTPGTYTVQFSNLPPGATFSPAGLGGNAALDSDPAPASGLTSPITVSAGDRVLTVDAGLVIPASLGDRVWNDANGNGLQDAGEPGVGGVTVTLFDGAGVQVAQVATDPSGGYLFTGLPAGNYTVAFTTLPAGTVLSRPNAGDDAVDSDADPTSGRTPTITLAAGEQNRSVDAGVVIQGAIIGTPDPTTLQIRKRPNKPVVRVNTNVVFTIVVRNTGTANAVNVKVCDKFPAGFRFVKAPGARFEKGRPCWTIASLAPGQTRTLRITLRAVRPGNRINTAWAFAENAPLVTTRAGLRILTSGDGTNIPRVTGETAGSSNAR